MPLRRKLLSRRGSQETVAPGTDKGSERERTSVSGRKSSFRVFRSFSMSLPSKENRRFPIAQKRKPSSDSQDTCLQPLDSNRHQVATEEFPGSETRRSSTPSGELASSSRHKHAGQDVHCLIQVQEASSYLSQSSMESLDSPSYGFKSVTAVTRDKGVLSPQKTSTPIPLIGPSKRKQFDMVSISELSESPRRYGLHRGSRLVEEDEEVDADTRRSPSSSSSMNNSFLGLRGSDDNMTLNPPSSPLLMAVKRAVDSLNQYEDFEIIEGGGEGGREEREAKVDVRRWRWVATLTCFLLFVASLGIREMN